MMSVTANAPKEADIIQRNLFLMDPKNREDFAKTICILIFLR